MDLSTIDFETLGEQYLHVFKEAIKEHAPYVNSRGFISATPSFIVYSSQKVDKNDSENRSLA